MRIGPYALANALMVAPWRGVTDRPFRQLCKRLGQGYAVSEMVTSRPDLQDSVKTQRRANHAGEPGPIAVQIAGTEPALMAEAARFNAERCADHRHQHGLPGHEGVQQVGGFGADAKRTLAVAIAGRVVQGLHAAGRAGHAEDAHRLVPITGKTPWRWQAFEGRGCRW